MATEGTKFQVNYKLNDGTLINLYAASVAELETGLADLAMNAMNIRATGLELTGGGNSCRHGVMAFREGTSSKGPWKGYMCAAPKGATDKCDTIWVR